MEIKTKGDVGDIILVIIDNERQEYARIIRIDIMSMDRGCYACEYTLDLKRCTPMKDGTIKEENIIVAEHEIEDFKDYPIYKIH